MDSVVIWVTPANQIPSKSGLDTPWVMVYHKTRGWELPGGRIETSESIKEAAIRELKEETGYVGKKVLEIGRVESNPAIMSNHTYTYLALDCEKISDQSLDGTEDIEIVKKNIDEIPQLINEKEIEHALVISAFYFYNLYLMNKKHG